MQVLGDLLGHHVWPSLLVGWGGQQWHEHILSHCCQRLQGSLSNVTVDHLQAWDAARRSEQEDGREWARQAFWNDAGTQADDHGRYPPSVLIAAMLLHGCDEAD